MSSKPFTDGATFLAQDQPLKSSTLSQWCWVRLTPSPLIQGLSEDRADPSYCPMVSSFLSSPGSTHPGTLLTSLAAGSLNLYGPLLFILETRPQLALPYSRDLAYKELLRLPSSPTLCCLPHRSLGQGLLSNCPSTERKQGVNLQSLAFLLLMFLPSASF